MRNKVIMTIIVILICTSCTDNKLKDHLKDVGFNCDGYVCKDEYEYTDSDENSYYSYGYNYMFNFKEKVFHMGNYQFSQQNGQVTSAKSNSYTYYWEEDTATAKNVVDNGTFEYNCNTKEISFVPMFSMKIEDNCKFLNGYSKYYKDFVNQCNILNQYCNECNMEYYGYIDY